MLPEKELQQLLLLITVLFVVSSLEENSPPIDVSLILLTMQEIIALFNYEK
jgi:energy-converting hydrogenase Eha subunit E